MEEQTNVTNQKSFPMGLMAIVLIVVLGIGIFAYQSRSNSASTQPSTETQEMVSEEKRETESTQNMAEDSAESEDEGNFKNGEYEAEGMYKSPGGDESIGVKLTLKDNIITDVTVESKATKPLSVQFQEKFISGFKELVVGKEIDDVQLDKVAGSSLTPKGFNEAIEKIKAEAKA
jgi:uncharacterized protein with FMN-binding domain